MRRRYFPPERNHIPAHLTLFHALPGAEAPSVKADLAAACAVQRPFTLEASGYRSLGRGVALAFRSPELVRFRQGLARDWRDWLTPQDSATISPHVTVQNKVDPAAARSLLNELQAGYRPFEARAEGVLLWRYLGGPWEKVRFIRFVS